MKTQTFVVSESGTPLMSKDDGFIVYGSIKKADDQDELFGDINSDARAYTVTEFLDGLRLDPEVFYQYYLKNKKPGKRQDGFTLRAPEKNEPNDNTFFIKDLAKDKKNEKSSTWGTDEFGRFRDLGIGSRPVSSGG